MRSTRRSGSIVVPAREVPVACHPFRRTAEQHRGRLHARARRDVFGRVGNDDRAARQVGDRALERARPRAPADEHDVARAFGRPRRVSASSPSSSPHTTPSNAARATSARLVRRAQPGERARWRRGGWVCVRRRNTGRASRRPRPRSTASARPSSPSASTPSQRRDRVGDLRRVERAHQRKEPAGGVGEAGDRAGRIGGRRVAHRVDGARTCRARSRRRRVAARRRARPPCCRRCRARRAASRPKALRHARRLGRAEHRGQARRPVGGAVDDRRGGRSGTRRARREVAGARRVTAVGDEARRSAGTVSQSCGRQHAREPRPGVGLAAVQPRELRDRERGDRHRAARVGPALRRRRTARPASRRRAPTRCRSRAWRAARPARRRRARPSRAAGRRPRARRSSPARPPRPRPRASASHHAFGSCSLRGGVVGGCGARPCATSAPVSASRTSTFVDCVDESTPSTSGMPAPRAAQRVPSSSSVTSWSSRSLP